MKLHKYKNSTFWTTTYSYFGLQSFNAVEFDLK